LSLGDGISPGRHGRGLRFEGKRRASPGPAQTYQQGFDFLQRRVGLAAVGFDETLLHVDIQGSEPAADFLIDAPKDHGLPGLVHLFGIESPGLTSALSLAQEVVSYLSS